MSGLIDKLLIIVLCLGCSAAAIINVVLCVIAVKWIFL